MMAVFNEILVGRFNRYLQKLTAIKGTAPIPALSTEIGAQFDLNSVPTEDRYLIGYDQFWQNNAAGPTAAVISSLRWRNPANSNVIAVVEFVGIWETVQDIAPPGIQIQLGAQVSDLTTVSLSAAALDSRSGRSHATLIPSGQAGLVGALPNTMVTFGAAAAAFFGLTLYDGMEIPLLPGIAIQIQTTAQNTSLNVDLKWRERFLEDSERA